MTDILDDLTFFAILNPEALLIGGVSAFVAILVLIVLRGWEKDKRVTISLALLLVQAIIAAVAFWLTSLDQLNTTACFLGYLGFMPAIVIGAIDSVSFGTWAWPRRRYALWLFRVLAHLITVLILLRSAGLCTV